MGNKMNKENSDCFFDWKFYLDKYNDLKKAGIDTKEKAKKHWEKYGK